MKKRIAELLILLVIAICSAVLLPNYFKYTDTIVLPSVLQLVKWALPIFAVLTLLYLGIKSSEKLASIPDGYQKLYNERSQITKEGVFKGGKLINGSRHVYNKDGTLLYSEICTNGIYTKDVSKNN